jgi:hypothetical protein
MLRKMWEKIVIKLYDALSTVWGWAVILSSLIIEFIGGHGTAVLMVLLAVVLDAVWGIVVAIRNGRFALSELGRDTIGKLAVYGTALVMFIAVDKLLLGDTTLTTSIVAALIILVEFWSASANMLICFPSMPFLKLMRKALKGEIARKLNINPDDVETVLNEKK